MRGLTHQPRSCLTFKHISLSDISDFRKNAEKEGLTFCKKAELYGVFLNRIMVGFTGLCFYKHKVVFKNHYVLPDYRKRGIFRKMLDWSIAQAFKRGIFTIEATCTAASLHEYKRRGFVTVQKYKIATKVRHENISRSKRI